MSLARFSRLPVRSTYRQFSVASYRMADSKFDKDGSVGKEFTTEGKIGGTAQKVGGPFAADGKIGKEFTEQGSIGGKAQEVAEDNDKSHKNVFDKDGAIGKEFQPDGKIGGAAQKLGGVFDKDGAIGKQFTDKGAIGGTVQENLGEKKS